MSNVKERIIGAVTVMSEENAEKIWTIIETNFSASKWDDIEEVEPDEIDLEMISEAKSDIDCQVFVSQQEVYKELGL